MAAKRVLVYGGKGALGSVCIKQFKAKNWWVGSIDLIPNEEAHANILVKVEDSWTQQQESILKGIESALKEGEKLDAVICVAGGWAGGSASNKDFIKNADLMWKQSVWSSAIAASVASKFLAEGGVLTLTGAQAALDGTPGMIGYGMAKAAVHQLVKSLAKEKSGMPVNAVTAAILPVTLDTPMNRKFMPNADHSAWTPLEFVADLFTKWTENESRPKNGSLVQLVTKEGKTDLVQSA